MTHRAPITSTSLWALFVVTLLAAPACFWEGRSGLDASAFDETFDFEKVQRSIDGYCQNEADQAVLNDPELDLKSEVSSCGAGCLFSGEISPCTSACVVDTTGLTEECADCYGDDTACTIEHCLNECMDSDSPECVACREQSCVAAFEACAG